MKGVLGWIKGNLLIVISTVVIVVSLPLGWFFSSGWNKKIQEQQEKAGNQAYNQVRGATVNYVIPSHDPDLPSWSESRAPNAAMTEYVRGVRETRDAQAREIVTEIEEFNRDGHAVLAEGLLPVPVSRSQETRLKYEFLQKMGGDSRLGREPIYVGLLDSVNAGTPPEPVRMATTLQDIQARESERILAETGQSTLTQEQTEELRKVLMERRVAEVQRRAKEISVYANLGSFSREGFGPETSPIPPLSRQERQDSGVTDAPTLAEVFEWNFDYWIVSDLFEAIDRANTQNGVRANVEHAVVKRVDGVSVKSLPIKSEEKDTNTFDTPEPAASEGGLNPAVSHTGRTSNSAYDVVHAKMSVVVDANRIPELIRAIAQTNLMTVLDLDVTEVDVWGDLRQGYYYGSEPVVRADLLIETVWLRSWTEPLMPASVKTGLGITTDEEPGDD